MEIQTSHKVKIADEVWIAAALLHRARPRQEDFAIDEIVQRVEKEGLTDRLRPGVYVHALQHCVANRPPDPGRYCMLFETAKGRRRLWKPGDRIDPKRLGAKSIPSREDIPVRYHALLDWYVSHYARVRGQVVSSDPILSLRGMGKAIWRGENPDTYVKKLREGWE